MKKTRLLSTIYILLTSLLFLVPLVVQDNYYRMLLDQALINIMVVMGLNFVTGLTGQMNLGMAGIFAVGAYTSALLTTRLGFSPWVAMIFVIAMGFIIGIMLGWPSLRIKGIYLSLTTIGFGEIIRLFLTNASDLTGGTHGVMQIPTYHFFRIKIDDSKKFYYFLLVFSIIMVVIALRVVHSKWGRVFKAIKDNEQAAEACGVNIAEIKIKAFILSTTYACVAGAFYAHLMGYINPADFNRDRSIKYLMMLMLGGLGSVPGSIIGGSVVTMLPEYLRFLKDYYWLIFSVIVLIIVMVLPHGLVSIFRNPFIVKERFAKNDSSKGRK